MPSKKPKERLHNVGEIKLCHAPCNTREELRPCLALARIVGKFFQMALEDRHDENFSRNLGLH